MFLIIYFLLIHPFSLSDGERQRWDIRVWSQLVQLSVVFCKCTNIILEIWIFFHSCIVSDLILNNKQLVWFDIKSGIFFVCWPFLESEICDIFFLLISLSLTLSLMWSQRKQRRTDFHPWSLRSSWHQNPAPLFSRRGASAAPPDSTQVVRWRRHLSL